MAMRSRCSGFVSDCDQIRRLGLAKMWPAGRCHVSENRISFLAPNLFVEKPSDLFCWFVVAVAAS